MTLDGRFATGFQLKSKVENGTDPIVEYFRKGSAASHLSVDDYHAAYFSSARHLHLSGVAAALDQLVRFTGSRGFGNESAGQNDLL